LLVKLKASNKVDWLVRATGAMKPDLQFLEKWVGAMKLPRELADAIIPNLSLQGDDHGGMVGAGVEVERMESESMG
jgi:hypothetical protein